MLRDLTSRRCAVARNTDLTPRRQAMKHVNAVVVGAATRREA